MPTKKLMESLCQKTIEYSRARHASVRSICIILGVTEPTFYAWLKGRDVSVKYRRGFEKLARRYAPALRDAWRDETACIVSRGDDASLLRELDRLGYSVSYVVRRLDVARSSYERWVSTDTMPASIRDGVMELIREAEEVDIAVVLKKVKVATLARRLGVSQKKVYGWVEKGVVETRYRESLRKYC